MLESVFGCDYKSFIKLIDFGYSLDLSPEASLSQENLELILRHIMGTFSYTAPELLEQKDSFKDQFKIESDMWSLGVILFQMVSAKLPFDEEVDESGVADAGERSSARPARQPGESLEHVPGTTWVFEDGEQVILKSNSFVRRELDERAARENEDNTKVLDEFEEFNRVISSWEREHLLLQV